MDTKAKVKLGPFSRCGKSRLRRAAADHDRHPLAFLVPSGVLEVSRGARKIQQLNVLFGHSRETADFIVDGLKRQGFRGVKCRDFKPVAEFARIRTISQTIRILANSATNVDEHHLGSPGLKRWWWSRREQHPGVRRLMIELDNGPEISSARTRFLKRLVEFVDETGLEIELVDLPPYHSKYNPIECGWGVLEQLWNGALFDTIETALEWARTMHDLARSEVAR